MVFKGFYRYTDHLISLNSFPGSHDHLVSYLSLTAHSPLNLPQWQQELCFHPDKRYVRYILQGIEEGFRIGFNNSQVLQSTSSNLSTPHPSIISDYLSNEVSLNRMWKYPHNAIPKVIHISPVGAIPKRNKPGKYRLIMDLSSPRISVLMMGLIQYCHLCHALPLIIFQL